MVPFEGFHASRSTPTGLASWCKQCRRAEDKAIWKRRSRVRAEKLLAYEDKLAIWVATGKVDGKREDEPPTRS